MNRRLFVAVTVGAIASTCAASLASSPALAAQAAPAHLHASEQVSIAAPPDKVWGIIQNFSDLTWHPAIKKSSATNGNKVGSVRTLDLGGPLLIEQLTRYDAARHSYSYKITADPNNVKTLPLTHYTSTIVVKAGADGGSTVVWRGHFQRADFSATPAAGQGDEDAVKAAAGVYRGGLDNLKKLAEAK